MRICIVHNDYGIYSGEEAVVDQSAAVLRARGHDVAFFRRSSREIAQRRLGTIRAFFSGIANPASARQFARFLNAHRPDVVHIHNLYPLISPSILPVCRAMGVPVVMTIHNFRLICPWGLFMSPQGVCERCYGGEHWCFLLNCAGNRFKSLGYALRNVWARTRGLYKKHVSLYIALNHFQKGKLVQAGYPEDRIHVIPNMVDAAPAPNGHSALDRYVGFAGRLSEEKGIGVLFEAARCLPRVSFHLAGNGRNLAELGKSAPNNVRLLGHLHGEAFEDFFGGVRLLTFPSVCYEGFPTVLPQAMLRSKPVVCSRLGGLSEIVEDGRTGLLTEAGNPADLAEKIERLWSDPPQCHRMGAAGREKALRLYSADAWYVRTLECYQEILPQP